VTPTELLIVGTGGLAKEAAQLARRIDPRGQRWHRIAYVTHDSQELGRELIHGAVEHLDSEVLQRSAAADLVIGTGHAPLRRLLAQRFAAHPGLSFPNLIHPLVEIDPSCVTLGRGNMITQGVVMTCDIRIGDFNLFNWNCTVGHDVVIGSFNVINPSSSVSGHVRMGDACLLGTGCRILERLALSSDLAIGAGAVVTKSISEVGTYVGVPARRVQQ